MIDGKLLDELSLREIVEATANPERPFFAGGDRMDYTRNVSLLALYGTSSALDAEAIADRYHFEIATGAYTTRLNALRAGELIAWAISQRLVVRSNDRWHLVETERVFELCGPELRPKAVRVRGLEGAEAIVADKIWQRELKRREKARVKRVGYKMAQVREMAEYIGMHEPGSKIGPDLQRYAVAGVDTIIGCSDLILASMMEMTVKEADAVSDAVRRIYIDVQHRVWLASEAERQREREDMASIAAAFSTRPVPPPPPSSPRPQDIGEGRCRALGSMDLGTD
ncbi:MAG: hypothetical protein KIT02_03120 [Devosia sp.]|uniref:hypothetical protein n=1 Tax=Devosia sp. TaxID=1871048 RepID=UPI0024CC41BD|nr:hypothetical protein [Devosia sp.]UYO00232.1 MAG: hypothetical protein KIT02_03120 [Devosia sp.]